MYARVNRYSVPIGLLEQDIALSDEIARFTVGATGSRGYYYLVDRQTGATMGVSLWEGEQAMRDAEQVTTANVERRRTQSGARVVSRESYEVVSAASTATTGLL